MKPQDESSRLGKIEPGEIDESVHISSPRDLTGSGWQILGELELPVGSNMDDAIKARLMEILNPLHLHADFLNKVLKSAQDAAPRVLQNGMKFKHIHLLVFAPSDRAATGRTWGFFRIEKVGAAAENGNPPDHAIEFYLYVEGR